MKAALATIFFLLLSMAAFGQSTTPSTYLIRQDDVLRIQIYGETQVNNEVTVGEDGNISAPFVGLIHAAGRTTAELEDELTVAYKKNLRLREPKVSVTFSHYAPKRAWVGGAVAHPGAFEFRQGDTLATLLHEAGDPVEGLANEHRAVLHHKGIDEGIPVDLYALLRKGDVTQNYELRDGDILEVPSDPRNKVNVLGYIGHPGPQPFREPMTLADAVAGAGGEIPGKSMMSRIVILRELPAAPGTYLQIKPNFVAYEHGDASQNVELQPNDFIFVPATNTPDLPLIANVVSSAFYIDTILRNGIFGFRFFH